MGLLSTRSNFIEKAIIIHNDLYNYDKVVYVNSRTKVTITCKVHGDWEQLPSAHIAGKGCRKCADLLSSLANTSNKESFILRAKDVHQGIYSYEKVVYKGHRDPVIITCEHGDFIQTPRNHLQGSGCTKCSHKRYQITTEEFILKANNVHSGHYSYDNTVYEGTHSKVTITCPIHGNFQQTPANHLRGCGCNVCNTGGFRCDRPGKVYYLSINNGEAYKIGITNRSVNKRYSKDELKKIKVLWEISFLDGQDANDLEKEILLKYKQHIYYGPPILMSGNTELFNCDIRYMRPK